MTIEPSRVVEQAYERAILCEWLRRLPWKENLVRGLWDDVTGPRQKSFSYEHKFSAEEIFILAYAARRHAALVNRMMPMLYPVEIKLVIRPPYNNYDTDLDIKTFIKVRRRIWMGLYPAVVFQKPFFNGTVDLRQTLYDDYSEGVMAVTNVQYCGGDAQNPSSRYEFSAYYENDIYAVAAKLALSEE